MRIANRARCALLMNHLWPLITHSSPSWYAHVLMSVGSEPATSGSVIAKHDALTPSHNGFRYFCFCSSVPQCNSVCMLPSSGACALMANGPKLARAASACTIASSTWPSPIPPHSWGMWGSQIPRSLRSRAHLDDAFDELSVVVAIHRLLEGPHHLVDQRAHAVADVFELGGETEVDGHSRRLASGRARSDCPGRRATDRHRRRPSARAGRGAGRGEGVRDLRFRPARARLRRRADERRRARPVHRSSSIRRATTSWGTSSQPRWWSSVPTPRARRCRPAISSRRCRSR